MRTCNCDKPISGEPSAIIISLVNGDNKGEISQQVKVLVATFEGLSRPKDLHREGEN